jgi:hypothetical protein
VAGGRHDDVMARLGSDDAANIALQAAMPTPIRVSAEESTHVHNHLLARHPAHQTL